MSFIHRLKDWRNTSRDVTGYNMKRDTDRIDISFETGAFVWIELEAGAIVVHCYRPNEDEPVNTRIRRHRITVDTGSTDDGEHHFYVDHEQEAADRLLGQNQEENQNTTS